MLTKQKIILIHNNKGGCGISTITSTLSRKLMKPKKTVLITVSKYSQYTYDKCGVKSQIIYVNSLNEICEDINTKNKILKKYEYIIFDISENIDKQIISQLYKCADMIIIPVTPLQVSESILKDLSPYIEETKKTHIYTVITYTKQHYNLEKLEYLRKFIDQYCKKHSLKIFSHYIGYNKNIENENKILDSKDCKLAITEFIQIIKSLNT